MAQQLPPQFFYLAMQESNFDSDRSRSADALGLRQGHVAVHPGDRPEIRAEDRTARRRMQRLDPADERLDWEKATRAAARYIKDIYATDAQASGLLVMASYNWGERRVIDRLRKMPSNPRERNFWKLLAQYPEDVPQETYDYVFSIVSAAVIGENPRLFGFQFDNPLAFTGSSR